MLTEWRTAQAGECQWPVKVSADRCHGWKTTGCCVARASSSPTFACPACANWRSCAARVAHALHPRRSQARGAEAVFHRRRSDGRAADRRGIGVARIQAVGAARAGIGQGAACRRADRRLCRGQPRGGGRSRRRGRGRFRRTAGGRGHARRADQRTRLHDHWPDNVFLETFFEVDLGTIRTTGANRGRRRKLRTARQCMSPLEGRGVVAPGIGGSNNCCSTPRRRCRTSCGPGWPGVSGLDQARIRVVAPDVGGGFGYKGILLRRGSVCRVAGAPSRLPGTLDRGSARAAHRQRQLPRASTTTSRSMRNRTAR